MFKAVCLRRACWWKHDRFGTAISFCASFILEFQSCSIISLQKGLAAREYRYHETRQGCIKRIKWRQLILEQTHNWATVPR